MSRSRVGLRIPPVPGITTLVRDQGDTAPDETKERALPPGSATPGVPVGEGVPSDKAIGQPQFNKPDNGIPERTRTVAVPGDEYGHPIKNDYNYVTRRTAEEREAYTRRWRPGRRQQRSRGMTRTKRRLWYRKNRARIKQKAKLRYKRVRHNPRFKALIKHRRKNPNQHRRRRAAFGIPDPTRVAAVYLEGWEAPKDIYPQQRQRRQRPADRLRSRRYYRRDRARKIREQLKRYHNFCKHNPKCLKKREEQRKHPQRFKRRAPGTRTGSVLTTPGIYFAIGPQLLPGVVRTVSPLTGMVTFSVLAKDEDHLRSMSLLAFLYSVVFLSEADIDAFFDLVDIEVGDEAYADFTPSALQECLITYQVDINSPQFRELCGDLSEMTPDQLEDGVYEAVSRILAYGDMSREESPILYGDPKVAGILFQYDQESPVRDVNYPADGAHALPSGPTTWQLVDVDDSGGAALEIHRDEADPSTSRVQKQAVTMGDLANRTSRTIHERARKVAIRLRRADPKRGIWMFEARGSKGSYKVRLKALRKGNIKRLAKAQVLVSCTCDFFRFQGPEHWALTGGYLYGKPRGTAAAPKVKDPKGQHLVCKHVLAALQLARKYRLASLERNSVVEALPLDRSSLIRYAATLPAGSTGRRDLLRLVRGT